MRTGSDVAVLLRAEHAVARVLASARSEADAYPALLAAIGQTLGWDIGAVWAPAEAGTLRCAETWPDGGEFVVATRELALAADEGLPGRVWTDEAPAWITDVPDSKLPRARVAARGGLRSAFAFPVRGAAKLGVIELFTADRRDVDDDLLATMDSLGSQIGQFVERCRVDARRRAILNAAFDCVITMDDHGNIVEV